jgi:hypothetical protein
MRVRDDLSLRLRALIALSSFFFLAAFSIYYEANVVSALFIVSLDAQTCINAGRDHRTPPCGLWKKDWI